MKAHFLNRVRFCVLTTISVIGILLMLLAASAVSAASVAPQGRYPAQPVPTSRTQSTVNLLANPGLEDGDYSPSGNPAGWTRDSWSPSAGFTWDDQVVFAGSKSVKIELATPNDARWTQTVAVRPHTLYVLSGWIKTANVAPTGESVDAGANLSLLGTYTRSAGLLGTNGWEFVSVSFNSDARAEVTVAVRLGFYSGTTTGTAWFDDLRLEAVREPVIVPNLLHNPGFERGDLQPSSWAEDAWAPSSQFSWTDQQFFEGSRSVGISSASPNDARWIQTAAVRPNTDYVLAGWVKTTDIGHSSEPQDIGANLSVLGKGTLPPNLKGTNEWTRLAYLFNSQTSSSAAVAARLGFYSGTNTGAAWFDDLWLIEGRRYPWRMLVLIYRNIDVDFMRNGAPQHLTASMTEADVQRARSTVALLPTTTNDWSGGAATVQQTIVEIDRPITSLSSLGAEYYWPSPADTREELDTYAPPGAYDSIVVIWVHDKDGLAIDSYGWGLTLDPQSAGANGAGYTTVNVPDNHGAWPGPYPDEIFVHEWLHQVLGYYAEIGFTVPNLDRARDYGYDDAGGTWRPFLSDVMQGAVWDATQSRDIGVSDAIWRMGTPTQRLLAVESTFDCSMVDEIPQAECQALTALYSSANGPGWTNNSDWLATNTPCGWYGVTCDAGHVDQLSLVDNHLNGIIPAELGDLTHLTRLNLSYNQLSGSIPSELGHLVNLQYLDLAPNQLTGSIPSQLGDLTGLTELYLSFNQLSGNIPSQLGVLTNLQRLDLSSNQLKGDIPSQLGNLTNLQFLGLSANQLSGEIPAELGNLANLQTFWAAENRLSGSLPAQMGNLTSLRSLGLARNQLSGGIPPELGSLSNLFALGLNGNQLSGSIPPEFGNLQNLFETDLSDNQLSGRIPMELGNLTNLQDLRLSANQLSGPLPQALINLPLTRLYFDETALCEPGNAAFQAWLAGIDDLRRTGAVCKAIYLPTISRGGGLTFDCNRVSEIPEAECQALVMLYNSTNGPAWTGAAGWLVTNTPCSWHGVMCNAGHVAEINLCCGHHLVGNIPAQLANLTNLLQLDLSFNGWLSGGIPPELGTLANLRTLYLGSNQLSGSIPPQLGNLANLENLSLSSNQLSGSIPPQLGNLANLEGLSLAANQLSGSIPPQLGNLANLVGLALDQNQLSGSIPPELGNLTNMDLLRLHSNRLSGSIPPELGNLTNLWQLDLSENQLSGPLPQALISLHLTTFYFDRTALCEPANAAFQAWLARIGNLRRTGAVCGYTLHIDVEPFYSGGRVSQDPAPAPDGTYPLTLAGVVACRTEQ